MCGVDRWGSTDLGENPSLPLPPRKGTCVPRWTQVSRHEDVVSGVQGPPILQRERGQTEESVNEDDEKRKVRAVGRDYWTTPQPQPEDYLSDTKVVPLCISRNAPRSEKGIIARLAPCARPTQASKSGA